MAKKSLTPEQSKNLAIYNEVAKHARRAFSRVILPAGVYKPADIVRAEKRGVVFFFFDKDENVTVEIDNFNCSFLLCDSFRLLSKLATAYGIPAAHRVTFERTEEENEDLRDILRAEEEEARKKEEEERRARIIEEGNRINERIIEQFDRFALVEELPTKDSTTQNATESDTIAPVKFRRVLPNNRRHARVVSLFRWIVEAVAVIFFVIFGTSAKTETNAAACGVLPVVVFTTTETATMTGEACAQDAQTVTNDTTTNNKWHKSTTAKRRAKSIKKRAKVADTLSTSETGYTTTFKNVSEEMEATTETTTDAAATAEDINPDTISITNAAPIVLNITINEKPADLLRLAGM